MLTCNPDLRPMTVSTSSRKRAKGSGAPSLNLGGNSIEKNLA